MRPSWHRTARLTISLPAEMAEALRETVESRRFASVSEVIREALRDWLISATRGRPLQLHHPARPRPVPASDITDAQLCDLAIMARLDGLRRFAIRGSARKRRLDCAADLGAAPQPVKGRPVMTMSEMRDYLAFHWQCHVSLIPFDRVRGWDEWTLVFDVATDRGFADD